MTGSDTQARGAPGHAVRLIALGACICALAGGEVVAGDTIENHPFRRYFTRDKFDRRVSFYLSEARAAESALPLIVFIQGTGCSSHFTRAGTRILAGVPSLLHQAAGGRAQVLAVDKPGVEYLDDQGGKSMEMGCQPEFFQEHTLDRWTEAVVSSIQASRELPGIDSRRALVIGISEGGMVAIRVSRIDSTVTHAASLSGGGPNHLYVLAEFVRRRGLNPDDLVFACWDRVRAEPDSATKFCLDHSYRHWSSFYNTSLIEECLRSKAKLYFVHGSDDQQNSVRGFDVLRAELAAKGRRAVFQRLEGAGHSLDLPGQKTPEGLLAVFDRLVNWFHNQ